MRSIAVAMLCVAFVPGCSKSDTRPVAPALAERTIAALPADAARGAGIFETNCATCHGSRGTGGGIGPVLTGERTRKSYAAAVAWIEEPGAGAMPKLYPAAISETDVHDVAAYVETL